MSLQPAQSSPFQRVASRRNVVRGAAWTTAAVTVVVATPNIAAASTHEEGIVASLTVDRDGTLLNLSTSIAGGDALIGPVDATVTFAFSGGSSRINARPSVKEPWTTQGWTGTSATFRATAVAPSPATPFRPTVNLNNASFESVLITVVFTWPGGSRSVQTTYVK